MSYFSEREQGQIPRDRENVYKEAWRGILALIQAHIVDGSFGTTYPRGCDDGLGPMGTDESAFWYGLRAEARNLPAEYNFQFYEDPPDTLTILDIVEFCWRCIGSPINIGYHEYFKHRHLRFDVNTGRGEFRENINRIFRRNGLAYELTEDGLIQRLAAPALREELASATFSTGDAELDLMLETARRKFLDPDETVRREALEVLWDAWERAKTHGTGHDKKSQIKSLLDKTANSTSNKFRDALEREAKELTWIGNNLQIRHSETNQEKLSRSEHVDYLFHRLFSMIQMILKTAL